MAKDADTVRWSQWSWEGPSSEDSAPLPDLPVCRFDREAYESAVRTAADSVTHHAKTVMRVRRSGSWWQNLRSLPEYRDDEATMLGWLQAEAATPSFEEAEGTYFDILAALDYAQSLISGAVSSKLALIVQLRIDALEALRSVDTSPHRISLPSHTQEAVGWFLADLA